MSEKFEMLSGRAAVCLMLGCFAITAGVVLILKRSSKLEDFNDDDTTTVWSESDSPTKTARISKPEKPSKAPTDEDLENDLNLIGEV